MQMAIGYIIIKVQIRNWFIVWLTGSILKLTELRSLAPFRIALALLEQGELHLGGVHHGEEGAALVVLGRHGRQDTRDPDLAPISPHFTNVNAVKVAENILKGNPKDSIIVSMS